MGPKCRPPGSPVIADLVSSLRLFDISGVTDEDTNSAFVEYHVRESIACLDSRIGELLRLSEAPRAAEHQAQPAALAWSQKLEDYVSRCNDRLAGALRQRGDRRRALLGGLRLAE